MSLTLWDWAWGANPGAVLDQRPVPCVQLGRCKKKTAPISTQGGFLFALLQHVDVILGLM